MVDWNVFGYFRNSKFGIVLSPWWIQNPILLLVPHFLFWEADGFLPSVLMVRFPFPIICPNKKNASSVEWCAYNYLVIMSVFFKAFSLHVVSRLVNRRMIFRNHITAKAPLAPICSICIWDMAATNFPPPGGGGFSYRYRFCVVWTRGISWSWSSSWALAGEGS